MRKDSRHRKFLSTNEEQDSMLESQPEKGMPNFNRRTVLGGLALVPAAAVPIGSAAANIVQEQNDVPAETAAGYAAQFSAEDRVLHHLFMAAQAMNEISNGTADLWTFSAIGGREKNSWCRADIFPDEQEWQNHRQIEVRI